MWSEDFACVLERVPGAILWLGVKNAAWPEPKAIHTAEFELDESALPIGSSAMAGVALAYLMRA
jgi:IAA-amino acid hydrolase